MPLALSAAVEEDASALNPGFFLSMLWPRVPPGGEKEGEREGVSHEQPLRKPRGLPNPLRALVLSLWGGSPLRLGNTQDCWLLGAPRPSPFPTQPLR